MSRTVGVIDYGMGNLRSVEKALIAVGARARVIETGREIRDAKALVLPGVGAFGQAVDRLKSKGLFGPIQDALQIRKPFLGICLGLQLLFEKSEESPRSRGFGYLKGSVVRFKSRRKKPFKVPHMGWNTIKINRSVNNPFLKGISDGEFFYFVHSFFPVPCDSSLTATTTQYGQSFCSAVASPNLFACQFHPEKSGKKGLQILSNFARRAA